MRSCRPRCSTSSRAGDDGRGRLPDRGASSLPGPGLWLLVRACARAAAAALDGAAAHRARVALGAGHGSVRPRRADRRRGAGIDKMTYPIVVPNGHIYEAIADERERQERLKREGRFTYTCADAAMP